MPQQPKITGDAEVDSWALQTTQELNNLNSVIANPPGTAGENLSRVRINGIDYNIAASGAGTDNEFEFPQSVTFTNDDRLMYRFAFTAARTTATSGRGAIIGYGTGGTRYGFDYGVAYNADSLMPANGLGVAASTLNSRYTGYGDTAVTTTTVPNINSRPVSLPPDTPAWNDFRTAVPTPLGADQGWAFFTGTGGTNRGTQFGFSIPHPILATVADPITAGSYYNDFPYVPLVGAAGSITATIIRQSDNTRLMSWRFTPATNDVVTAYGGATGSVARFTFSSRGSFNYNGTTGGSGTTGGVTTPTITPFVVGENYIIELLLSATYGGNNFNIEDHV